MAPRSLKRPFEASPLEHSSPAAKLFPKKTRRSDGRQTHKHIADSEEPGSSGEGVELLGGSESQQFTTLVSKASSSREIARRRDAFAAKLEKDKASLQRRLQHDLVDVIPTQHTLPKTLTSILSLPSPIIQSRTSPAYHLSRSSTAISSARALLAEYTALATFINKSSSLTDGHTAAGELAATFSKEGAEVAKVLGVGRRVAQREMQDVLRTKGGGEGGGGEDEREEGYEKLFGQGTGDRGVGIGEMLRQVERGVKRMTGVLEVERVV